MDADELAEVALRRAHDVLKEDCGDPACRHDTCEAWRLVEAALAACETQRRLEEAGAPVEAAKS